MDLKLDYNAKKTNGMKWKQQNGWARTNKKNEKKSVEYDDKNDELLRRIKLANTNTRKNDSMLGTIDLERDNHSRWLLQVDFATGVWPNNNK